MRDQLSTGVKKETMDEYDAGLGKRGPSHFLLPTSSMTVRERRKRCLRELYQGKWGGGDLAAMKTATTTDARSHPPSLDVCARLLVAVAVPPVQNPALVRLIDATAIITIVRVRMQEERNRAKLTSPWTTTAQVSVRTGSDESTTTTPFVRGALGVLVMRDRDRGT